MTVERFTNGARSRFFTRVDACDLDPRLGTTRGRGFTDECAATLVGPPEDGI